MNKLFSVAAALLLMSFANIAQADEQKSSALFTLYTEDLLELPSEFPAKFIYDSGIHIEYPTEGVKGVYASGHSAGGARLHYLTELIQTTDLNAIVVDIKDDFGDLTLDVGSDNQIVKDNTKKYIEDPAALMKTFEKHEIYPIARVVVFKDTRLAEARPELTYLQKDGTVWKNNRGEAFTNPFSEEVWEYNIDIAKQAAKLGFKEIQFDYVRFPEGFETRADRLTYSKGTYEESTIDETQKRVEAVTDFVKHARKELQPFGVEISVDIFGYSATVPEAPGIGQNFSKISENVDVISSMIYPSHWGSYFGISKPDLQPYKLVKEYIQVENEVLGKLKNPPQSRPWIQDFTASYLGAGNYQQYRAPQIEAQIKALAEGGIDEFLLWNASNRYSSGVNYSIK